MSLPMMSLMSESPSVETPVSLRDLLCLRSSSSSSSLSKALLPFLRLDAEESSCGGGYM